MAPHEPAIELKNVSVRYGAVQAIESISFTVPHGQIVTLIGSNGAGKTTTLRAISGLTPVASGEVLHHGKVLNSTSLCIPPHEIVRRGLSHAPEGRGIFLNLTIDENLDLGAWCRKKDSDFDKDLDHVFSLFPRLKERQHQNAGTLSGGEQQMLAIGRALMSRPEILLLDEPSLGLAPQIIEKIFEIIVTINQEGKTVLLVEQNALQALQVAHFGVVLETGRVSVSGPASELLKSDQVRQAYLGE